MKTGDNQWKYYFRGTQKQLRGVIWLIGFAGASSSLVDLLISLTNRNFNLLTAGLLSLSTIPFLNWIQKHTKFVDPKTPYTLGTIEWLFLGFVFVTFVPLSSSYFFGSIYNVALIDFALLLIGSPAFSHVLLAVVENISISRNHIGDRYGL